MARTLAAALYLFASGLLIANPANAEVRFHPLFTDGIVLQRDVPVAIYGKAEANETVTVEFGSQQKQTIADAIGDWRVDLDPLVASTTPTALTATGDASSATVQDVLVGEVWVCAGQSNMVQGIVKPEQMALKPLVRWRRYADFAEGPGEVCWDFAIDLHDALAGVPVMVLNNARRGTKIRQWLSPRTVPDLDDPVVDEIVNGFPEWAKFYPDVEFLQPFTVRGIAWWQGESDSKTGVDHQHLLPAMIRQWRIDWGLGDIPFVIMQLPTGRGMKPFDRARKLPYKAWRTDRTAEMSEAFYIAQRDLPAVSLVVSADLRGGTHPPSFTRPIYADRILEAALANVYGVPMVWSGPVLESMTLEGSALRLHFRENTAIGLQGLDRGEDAPIQGFAISPDGESWEWADSIVVDGQDLLVSSSLVLTPTRLRYGWGKRTKWANLFNSDKRGAAPFQQSLP